MLIPRHQSNSSSVRQRACSGELRLVTRLRFLFVAAKIWKHSGGVGISYSDQYAERGLFQRLMKRLREIATGPAGFLPVLATSLSG